MGARESKIENHLRNKIIDLGGLCEKWGDNGNPDRIVVFGGKVYMIEIKTPDGSYTVRQRIKLPKYKKQGVRVRTLDSMRSVDRFVEMLRANVKAF